MQLLSLLSLFSLLIASNALFDLGILTWSNLGKEMKTHVAGVSSYGVNISGNALSELQQYEPAVYIMNESGGAFYRLPSLLNRGIKFTVDLSSSTCSCNAALFMVELPDNDTHCDAQGNDPTTRCFEMDLIEANTRGFQGTLHCVDGSQDCKAGCGGNFRSDKGYGPGGANIDTQKPYEVYVTFTGTSQLESINFRLTQSGKNGIIFTIDRTTCKFWTSQLTVMSNSIKSGRMVFIISYWSSPNMGWLDGCSTGQTCPKKSNITFRKIQVIPSTEEKKIFW